jgi:hypothetical protein
MPKSKKYVITSEVLVLFNLSSPLKPMLGGVRDVVRIHYPLCTDSIKLSLQFSCYFVVINASEGSLCFQIFIWMLCSFSNPVHDRQFKLFFYNKYFKVRNTTNMNVHNISFRKNGLKISISAFLRSFCKTFI